MRVRIATAFILLFFCCLKTRAQVSDETVAQVSRYLEEQTKSLAGNLDRFTALTQPYAPLDFQLRQGNSKEDSAVRNYLFGAASAAAGLSKDVAPKMANEFHCGQPCATSRIKEFVEQHERVTALVMRFVPLNGLDIVAQWGIPGELRINDSFVHGGSTVTFKPAGPLGIIPNSSGSKASDLTVAANLAPIQVTEARSIAADLASLHLAAIVRSPQGIRVIRAGNADNQAGLLFKVLSAPVPKAGDTLGEGLDLDGVTMLAKDIYYFETN